MSYNLDEAPETFGFRLGGHEYSMKYPNTDDMQAIADQSERTRELTAKAQQSPDDKALAKDLADASQAQEQMMYGLIEAKDDGAPAIQAALKSAGVNVLKNFRKMIETELSVTD